MVRQRGKQLVVWLIVLAMTITLLPAAVFAEGEEETTYTVTFHTGYNDEARFEGGETVYTEEFTEGSDIDPLDYYGGITSNTASFAGWAQSPDATGDDGWIMVEGDMDLYAVWEVRVRFDAGPGEAVGGDYELYVAGQKFTEVDKTAFYDYYDVDLRFDGWYTEPIGGEKLDSETVVTKNMTVYAHWIEPETTPLALDTITTVSADYNGKIYSFTPETTGTYKLVSSNNIASSDEDDWLIDYFYPHVRIYDSAWNWVREYYYNSGSNLSCLIDLEGGKTYYFHFLEADGYSTFHYDIQIRKTETVNVTFYANHEHVYLDEIYDAEDDSYQSIDFSERTAEAGGDALTNTPYPDYSYDLHIRLIGWSTDPNATEAESNITAYEGLKLYGVWVDEVPVTFHTNLEKDEARAYYVSYDNETWEEIQSPTYVEYYSEGSTVDLYTATHFKGSYSTKYSFQGWSTDPNATEAEEEIAVSEGLELYGVWKKVVPVTFHTNLEEAYFEKWDNEEQDYVQSPTEVAYYSEDSVVNQYDHNYFDGNYYEKYRFQGWSTDPNATEPEEEIVVKEGLELYGVWKKISRVTMDANGGYFYNNPSETQENYTVFEGELLSYVDTPQNADLFLAFAGWYTAAEGGTKIDLDSYKFTESTTLYAHWEKPETVTIKAKELLPAASDFYVLLYSFTPETDGTYVLTVGGSRNSYWFDGKIFDSEQKEITTLKSMQNSGNQGLYSAVLEGGKTYLLYLRKNSSDRAPINTNVQITKAATAKVTYDLNRPDAKYAEGETGVREYVIGQIISEYPAPSPATVPEGFGIIGWSRDPNAQTTESLYSITVKDDVTLYAVWGEMTSVTFHANHDKAGFNGTTNKENKISYFKGRTLNNAYIATPWIDDTTLSFAGWATTPDATEPNVDLSSAKAGEITDVYAVWKTGAISGVEEIFVGETKDVTYNGTVVRFSFTPKEDGVYALQSSDSTYDPSVHLYDNNNSYLANDDDSGSGWNFYLPYEMKAGKTYNYSISDSRWPSSCKVTLNKQELVRMTLDSNLGEHAWIVAGGENVRTFSLEKDKNQKIDGNDSFYTPKTDQEEMLFRGWSVKKDATAPDESITPSEGLTIYAVWEKGVPVTYDLNIGTEYAHFYNENEGQTKLTVMYTPDSWIYPTDDIVDFVTTYRNQKQFLGWSTDKNAVKPDSNSFQLKEAITLYAVWGTKEQVIFDANNGYFSGYGTFRVFTYNVDAMISNSPGYPISFDKTKAFAGWATTPDAAEPDISLGATPAADVKIAYAVWAEKATVTLEANGGSLSGLVRTEIDFVKGKTFGSNYRTPSYPDGTKIFDGWYDADGQQYDYSTVIDQDVTLFAKWADAVRITFDANGGFFSGPGEAATNVVSYRKGTTLNGSTLPNWQEYEKLFVGWFDAKEGGKEFAYGSVLDNDMTLYAHWKENPIESISVNDFEIVENTCGYFTNTMNGQGQYFYYSPEGSARMKVTVVIGGKSYTGTIRELSRQLADVIGSSPFYMNTSSTPYQSQDTPWTAGNTYNVTGTILGRSADFKVTIKKTPLANFKVDDISIIEGTHMSTIYGPDGNTYRHYEVASLPVYSFTWDGKQYSGTYVEIANTLMELIGLEYPYYPTVTTTDGPTNPWNVGTHKATATLAGLTCDFNVTINKRGENDFVIGDVNDDFVVNAKDVTILAKHNAKIFTITNEYSLKAADVNKDGVIDSKDLTLLTKYVAKIIPEL